MSGVFVNIRQTEQQFQHAVAVFRLGVPRAFFQINDNRERVGQKALKSFRIDGISLTAPRHGLVRAAKCFFQKVSQAHLFPGQTWRNQMGTRSPAAKSDDCSNHLLKLLRTTLNAVESNTVCLNAREKHGRVLKTSKAGKRNVGPLTT